MNDLRLTDQKTINLSHFIFNKGYCYKTVSFIPGLSNYNSSQKQNQVHPDKSGGSWSFKCLF